MLDAYTYSGKRVSREEGCPSVLDMAVALCRMARRRGAYTEFFPVSLHSFVVADLLPARLKVFGLIHDGVEIVTGDCPGLFQTDDFRALENRLERRLYADLDLPELSDDDQVIVKDADFRSYLGEVATIGCAALRSATTDRCPEAEALVKKYLDEYTYDDLLRPEGKAVQEFIRRFEVYRSLITGGRASSDAPKFRPFKIFLAGKVSREKDWRLGLVKNLYQTDMTLWRRTRELRIGNHIYCGTFPMNLDPEQLSAGTITDLPQHSEVFDKAISGIHSCDLFIVFADENFATAYGTLIELGVAKALGKSIVLLMKPDVNFDDQWFAQQTTHVHATLDDPVLAVNYLLEIIDGLREKYGDLPVRELLDIPLNA